MPVTESPAEVSVVALGSPGISRLISGVEALPCNPNPWTVGNVRVTSGPILWKSKKQDLVTTSTTEAEFVNLVPTAKSLEWTGSMLNDLGIIDITDNTRRILYTDSSNARDRALNKNIPARNRYIDIRYKWLIEQVERKAIEVIHISGEEMPADGLTKPLKADKHAKFVKLIGLHQKKVPWA